MPQLNPDLYQALQAAFGSVSVTNDGQPRQVLTLPDWQDGGRLRSQVVASGEQYRVELSVIATTRANASTSTTMGRAADPDGNDNLHLVKCFNENCVATRERQRDLLKRVYPLGANACQARSAAGRCRRLSRSCLRCPTASWCRWTRLPEAHAA